MIMLSGFRNHRNYNISRLKSKMYAHGFQKMFTSKHFKACFEMLVAGEFAPPPGAASKSSILPSTALPPAKPERPMGFQPPAPLGKFCQDFFEIPGRKTCKAAIFSPGKGISHAIKSPREATCLPFRRATFPAYTPSGTILVREGFASLELSREGVADISLFNIFLH